MCFFWLYHLVQTIIFPTWYLHMAWQNVQHCRWVPRKWHSVSIQGLLPTQVGRILLDMTEHCGLSPKWITKRKIRKTSPLQVDQSTNSLFHGDFVPSSGLCCRKLQATWSLNIATQFLLKPFGMGYPHIYAHKYKMHRHHFLKAVISQKDPVR